MQIDTLTIPDDFEWTDELSWSRWASSREYSLGGALLIDRAEKLAGRPVTLAGGDGVWLTRAELAPLLALADSGAASMPLTLYDGREFTVAFDYASGAPVTAEPLYRETAPGPDQIMTNITIKLITVE